MIQIGELKSGSIAAYSKNVQKASFQAYMSRIVQERIEDERRKKAGGGGGSSSYDKIKASMMYANFLSNKSIQAMLRNFNGFSVKSDLSALQNQQAALSKNIFMPNFIRAIFSFSTLTAPIFHMVKSFGLNIVKSSEKVVNSFALSLSVQINKLKDIFENEIKEKTKWKNLKKALMRTKEIIDDFIVEMKHNVQEFFLLFDKAISALI